MLAMEMAPSPCLPLASLHGGVARLISISTLPATLRGALNGLLLAARDPKKGHPRVVSYVLDAVRDSVLCANPCLHADVLIAKCDQSFAAGAKGFAKETASAEWDPTCETQDQCFFSEAQNICFSLFYFGRPPYPAHLFFTLFFFDGKKHTVFVVLFLSLAVFHM